MRRTGSLAAILLVLSTLMWTAAIVLAMARPDNTDPFGILDFIWGAGFLAFPVVGALIAWKRPDNAIGWLFLIGPLLTGAGIVVSEWTYIHQLGTSAWLVYAGDVAFIVGIATMASFFLLLFPTGRLPSRNWRFVAWIGVGGIATLVIWTMVRACSVVTLIEQPDTVPGPSCGDPAASWFIRFWNPAGLSLPTVEAILGIAGGVVVLVMFAGVASLFARYRTGSARERTQLKWLLGVLVILVPMALVLIVGDIAFDIDMEVFSIFVFAFALVGIPTSIGIAILRYRLFDIGRVINRTVTYTLVVIVLAVVFGAITIVPMLVVGTGEAPSWLIAASTLVVFTLFNPVRKRVQRTVDRRFNRVGYDPAAVQEALGRDLRSMVDQVEIASAWAMAAESTLHPRSLASWVRTTAP